MSTRDGRVDKSVFTPIKIKKELIENGINNPFKAATGRLTSFKVPRDLTLGGTGPLKTQRAGISCPGAATSVTNPPAKKVYTPNLNAVRNKNATVKTSRDTTNNRRGRGGRLERGRGGGGASKSGFIQTASVFSEGAGTFKIIRSSSGSSIRSTSERDESNALRMPKLSKNELKDTQVNKEEEQMCLKDLLGDSDDELLSESIDLENLPVKLSKAKWNANLIKIEKIDLDVVKKDEIADSEGCSDTIGENLKYLNLKADNSTQEVLEKFPTSLEELFKRTQPQMFVMQLPDCLPGQNVESEEPTTSSESTKSSFCSLKHLQEGQLGKIVRYKSGKYKMILGHGHFVLDLGMQCTFLEEAVSVETNRDERSGTMINIGPIQAKLNATPDWDYLFKNL